MGDTPSPIPFLLWLLPPGTPYLAPSSPVEVLCNSVSPKMSLFHEASCGRFTVQIQEVPVSASPALPLPVVILTWILWVVLYESFLCWYVYVPFPIIKITFTSSVCSYFLLFTCCWFNNHLASSLILGSERASLANQEVAGQGQERLWGPTDVASSPRTSLAICAASKQVTYPF